MSDWFRFWSCVVLLILFIAAMCRFWLGVALSLAAL